MDGSSHTARLEELDVPDAIFACLVLTAFAGVDALGLEVTGQRIGPDRGVLACRVLDDERWWRRWGCEGVVRDFVMCEPAHGSFGWRPTTLLVTVRRCRCLVCGHVWWQDTSRAAQPGARISRAAGIFGAHVRLASAPPFRGQYCAGKADVGNCGEMRCMS